MPLHSCTSEPGESQRPPNVAKQVVQGCPTAVPRAEFRPHFEKIWKRLTTSLPMFAEAGQMLAQHLANIERQCASPAEDGRVWPKHETQETLQVVEPDPVFPNLVIFASTCRGFGLQLAPSFCQLGALHSAQVAEQCVRQGVATQRESGPQLGQMFARAWAKVC